MSWLFAKRTHHASVATLFFRTRVCPCASASCFCDLRDRRTPRETCVENSSSVSAVSLYSTLTLSSLVVAAKKKKMPMPLSQPPQINATWPEKCLQPGVTRCNLEHNHRLTGPLRAGRQDPVLPEELLAEHVSALKEWARIPVAVRTQVCLCVYSMLYPSTCSSFFAATPLAKRSPHIRKVLAGMGGPREMLRLTPYLSFIAAVCFLVNRRSHRCPSRTPHRALTSSVRCPAFPHVSRAPPPPLP